MMLGLGLPITGLTDWQRRQSSAADPFKVVILGQSEDFYVINSGKKYPRTRAAGDSGPCDLLVAQPGDWRRTGGQSVTLEDAAVAGDARVTAGMVAMANVFMRYLPGREVHLVMLMGVVAELAQCGFTLRIRWVKRLA